MDPKERLRQARETPSPYEERYVALIDVLGWSEIIARSVADPGALPLVAEGAELISMARDWAEETNAITRALQNDFQQLNTDTRVSHFSDTFVFSLPIHVTAEATFRWMVGELCVRLLECGHYTRGALVRGLVRHTPSVLYGPAVVCAHQLESRVAKYPRILISPEVESAFETDSTVRRDFDGLLHLDILRPIKATADDIPRLEALRTMAETRAVEDADRLDLVAKHRWLLGYVNETLERARREIAG
jgi:hypothetical protein